jgi:hypothetical protein
VVSDEEIDEAVGVLATVLAAHLGPAGAGT